MFGSGSRDELSRSLSVIGDQTFEVEAFNLAVNHAPGTADHHPIGPVRAAQQQCGNRIMAAGETQLIKLEQRQVGLFAYGQFADIRAPQ